MTRRQALAIKPGMKVKAVRKSDGAVWTIDDPPLSFTFGGQPFNVRLVPPRKDWYGTFSIHYTRLKVVEEPQS